MLRTFKAQLEAREAELAAKHAQELAENAAKHAQELADAAVKHEQEMAAAAEHREAAAAEHHTYGLHPDLVERLRPRLAALQDKMDDGFGFWLKYQQRLTNLQKTIVVGTQGIAPWRTEITETAPMGMDDPVPSTMLPRSIAGAWEWSARGTQAQLNVMQEIVAIIREIGIDPSRIAEGVQRRQEANAFIESKKRKIDQVRTHGCECAEGDCTAGSRPGRVCTCTTNGLGCGPNCSCTRGKDRLNINRDKCANIHNVPPWGSRSIPAIPVAAAAASVAAMPAYIPVHQGHFTSQQSEMGMAAFRAQSSSAAAAAAAVPSELQLDQRYLALQNLPLPPAAAPGAVRQRVYHPLPPSVNAHIAAARASPSHSNGIAGCCQCLVKAGNCAGDCPCSRVGLPCTANCRCFRNKSKCRNPTQPPAADGGEGSDGGDAEMRAGRLHV